MTVKLTNSESGALAEKFVVEHVDCPYCGRTLVQLPAATPVYDVACERCEFRAQVKSVVTPPRGRIRGASARPLAGLRLAGKLSPPLLVVWGWKATEHAAHSITLFPLIPWKHIKERRLSDAHKTDAGRLMVDYHKLQELPHFHLYAGDSSEG